MSSFDYRAPAELFLAKPMKGSRTNIAVSQLRQRSSAMLSRNCARREPSELGCRWGMSASIVLKSNACTKRVISLRRDGDGRNSQDAPQLNQICYFGFTAAASST